MIGFRVLMKRSVSAPKKVFAVHFDEGFVRHFFDIRTSSKRFV
jgi:hypothetical protein